MVAAVLALVLSALLGGADPPTPTSLQRSEAVDVERAEPTSGRPADEALPRLQVPAHKLAKKRPQMSVGSSGGPMTTSTSSSEAVAPSAALIVDQDAPPPSTEPAPLLGDD